MEFTKFKQLFDNFIELNKDYIKFIGRDITYKLKYFLFLIYKDNNGDFFDEQLENSNINDDGWYDDVDFPWSNSQYFIGLTYDNEKLNIFFIKPEEIRKGGFYYNSYDDEKTSIINSLTKTLLSQYFSKINVGYDERNIDINVVEIIIKDNKIFVDNNDIDDIEVKINCIKSEKFPYVNAKISINLDENNKHNFLQYANSYLVNISAKKLHEIYKKFNNRGLFDANVRKYIKKAKIDDAIVKNFDTMDFWYYNNGITFVVKNASLNKNIFSIESFSIINGAQTTSLIGTKWNSDTHKNFLVLCRIICIENEDNIAYIEKLAQIAECLNTQKKLSNANLISNSTEIRSLKDYINNYDGNIYLSTKDGEYSYLKNSTITKIGGKIGFISLSDFLQKNTYFFLQSPYVVSNKAVLFNNNQCFLPYWKKNYKNISVSSFSNVWYLFFNLSKAKTKVINVIKYEPMKDKAQLTISGIAISQHSDHFKFKICDHGLPYVFSLIGLYALLKCSELKDDFSNIVKYHSSDYHEYEKFIKHLSTKYAIDDFELNVNNDFISGKHEIKNNDKLCVFYCKMSYFIGKVLEKNQIFDFTNFRKTKKNYPLLLSWIFCDENLIAEYYEICKIIFN